MAAHRASEREQARIQNLMQLVPSDCATALEVGARDCYMTRLLARVVAHVTALDLEMPQITHDHVTPVAGDVTALQCNDDSFDLVVSTEVLEHIKPHLLESACREIARVARRFALIGVPYRQDTRVGRTKCRTCGERNPAWAHLNVFDERRLARLFRPLSIENTCYIGQNRERTNVLSAWLMDMAGNPYGTYHQDERCSHCGSRLLPPADRNLIQKLFTRAAFLLRRAQSPFVAVRPNWIHILFAKRCSQVSAARRA